MPEGLVVLDREDASESAALEVQDVVQDVKGEGFQRTPMGDGWALFTAGSPVTLFALPSASDEVALGPGDEAAASSVDSVEEVESARADLEEIVERLVGEFGDRFLTVPLYRTANTNAVFPNPTLAVRFQADTSEAAAAEVIASLSGGEIVETRFANLDDVYLVELPGLTHGLDVLVTSHALHEHDLVEWAEPIFTWLSNQGAASCETITTTPTDHLFSLQWGHEQASDLDLDALTAWQTCSGSEAVTVAIIDDGIERTHPDFMLGGATSIVTGSNYVGPGAPFGNGEPTDDCENHGTSVAGVLAALRNGNGVVGLAPDVRLFSAKAHRQFVNAQGNCAFDATNTSDWAQAIADIVVRGIRIINHSWAFEDNPSALLEDEYDKARVQGVIAFAAAGNRFPSGNNQVSFPARYASVNAVSALRPNGPKWLNSNFGPGLRFGGPGVGVWTTDRTGTKGYAPNAFTNEEDFVSRDGTSYAAPYVAGIAALLRSLRPALSPVEIEAALCATATDIAPSGFDEQSGCGLVNAADAILFVLHDLLFADDLSRGDLSAWDRQRP